MGGIRPLASLSQKKRRKPHNCGVCGTLIETSIPRHCSPECVHIAWSEAAKRMMTPERITQFNSIRQRPTPEQQSATAKKYWADVKSWPIEKQKELYLRRAFSLRRRVIKVCVICGKEYDVVPSHADESRTCRGVECKRTHLSRIFTGRKHTPESIAKMRLRAREMWEKRRR